MQERLQLRSNMMPWYERAKTVLAIELTVQLEGKFDEVKQDKCVIETFGTMLLVRKATKRQEEGKTERLSNRAWEGRVKNLVGNVESNLKKL